MQQAVCVRRETKIEKKIHEQSAPPKTHDETHSSPATATTSGRGATKHVPRYSLYSPASIDFWFEEISFVHLSQSVKRLMLHIHTLTDTQTN